MPEIGLQLWTVRDGLSDPERLFQDVAAVGVTTVEPFGLGNPSSPLADRVAAAEALRRAAANAGLRIASTHMFLPRPEGVGELLEEVHALGATTALAAVPESLGGFARDAFETADSIARYADQLNSLAESAAAGEVHVGYHNHAWEWNELEDGKLAYDVLMEQLSDRVVIELDVLWAQFAGQDPVEIIRRLGPRIRLLHIDDAAPVTNTEFQVPAGAGDVLLAEAIASADPGIEVFFIEATTPPEGMTALQLVARSAAWLRSQIALRAL